MSLILDAGALVAIDRRDRAVGVLLRLAQQRQMIVRSSAGAVAQVWRDGARQVNLARTLGGIDVAALNLAAAKRIGPLLGATHVSDPIDGYVAQLAGPGDQVLTSDPDDIRRLLGERVRSITVTQV